MSHICVQLKRWFSKKLHNCLANEIWATHDSVTWHMSESPHTWMSRVTHMNTSCHIHVCSWIANSSKSSMTASQTRSPRYYALLRWDSPSRMTSYNDRCVYMNEQYEGVMSHIWVSHVTHTSESRLDDLIQRLVRVYEWAIWMSHVTHLSESCHTYEWVKAWWPHTTTGACIWMSNMNESCRTFVWVMPHIWMSHVTHMNESCHTYEWFMLHIWVSPGLMTSYNDRCVYVTEQYEWVMSHM